MPTHSSPLADEGDPVGVESGYVPGVGGQVGDDGGPIDVALGVEIRVG
jgi:hypothetical protein